MTLKDWIFSNYPEGANINGQWGVLHILTLVLIVATILVLTFTLRKKSDKAKKVALWIIAGLIIFFEISRRVINFVKIGIYDAWSLQQVLRDLLPRPWCAISCWCIVIAMIVNKKFFYNFASMISILCALVFFAYPGVGFNHSVILFENLYSIVTHSLLLISSVLFITLNKTEFKFKGCWKEWVSIGVVFIYAIFEIFVLRIENDPLFFMQGNEVQEILGLSYGLYLLVYFVFLAIYFNIYYIIQDRDKVKSLFKKNSNVANK